MLFDSLIKGENLFDEPEQQSLDDYTPTYSPSDVPQDVDTSGALDAIFRPQRPAFDDFPTGNLTAMAVAEPPVYNPQPQRGYTSPFIADSAVSGLETLGQDTQSSRYSLWADEALRTNPHIPVPDMVMGIMKRSKEFEDAGDQKSATEYKELAAHISSRTEQSRANLIIQGENPQTAKAATMGAPQTPTKGGAQPTMGDKFVMAPVPIAQGTKLGVLVNDTPLQAVVKAMFPGAPANSIPQLMDQVGRIISKGGPDAQPYLGIIKQIAWYRENVASTKPNKTMGAAPPEVAPSDYGQNWEGSWINGDNGPMMQALNRQLLDLGYTPPFMKKLTPTQQVAASVTGATGAPPVNVPMTPTIGSPNARPPLVQPTTPTSSAPVTNTGNPFEATVNTKADANTVRSTKPELYSLGNLTPDQYGSVELTKDQADAACGPAAAIAFARKFGKNPTLKQAVELAATVGWTAASGMAGPASQKALLDKMGVPSEYVQGTPNWARVQQELQSGNPVIISTPPGGGPKSPGHYFVAEGYDPKTGRYNFGMSAKILRQDRELGRNGWYLPEEIGTLITIGGPPRGALYLQDPRK
jgi:hypothetical protein